MTVSAELRGYLDKYNKQAIYIRISRGSKRTYIKTKLKVQPGELKNGKLINCQWENGKVINHPYQILYNGIIKKKILEMELEFVTPGNKFADADFYKYCENSFRQWEHSKVPDTLRQYRTEVNKLKRFAPVLKLSGVTPEWLVHYKAYCFALNNARNTVHKNLGFVKIIIRKAHREGLIEKNPFYIFEMTKYKNPEIKYLVPGQVHLIEKLSADPEAKKEIRFVATWFAIGCYTGLRFSDMQKFDKRKHIVNNRISLYTKKTGTPVSIPISNKLKKLFKQVSYKGLNMSNMHYNRILKKVGGICELDNLHAHESRHTAAIMWANAGISIEVTANLLGHTDLKSTAIYYKITSLRIDAELKKLDHHKPTGKIPGQLSIAFTNPKNA